MFIQHFSPQFGDAAATANAILNSGADYDQGKMMYNRYKSVVSYDTTALPLFSQENVMGAEKITAYDSVDADVVQSYLEFSLASLIYYAMKVENYLISIFRNFIHRKELALSRAQG